MVLNFTEWFLENGPDPKQLLFPWMSQEDPINVKKMSRYKSLEDYIKSQTRGSRKTEKAAETVVAAPPNSWKSGAEEIENIWHSEIVIPPVPFSTGQMRPEYHIAFVLLKKNDPFVAGNQRLVAVWQGGANDRITRKDLLDGTHPIIAGIVFKGPHITHVWADPNYKTAQTNVYKELMTFARKYLGVIGPEPGDKLTSRSFRTAQAKYDWKRYKGQNA
jgi:hypothetical protein